MDNLATYMANKQAADARLKVYHQVLEEDSLRPMELQESFLKRLLKDNKETEYGKRQNNAHIKQDRIAAENQHNQPGRKVADPNQNQRQPFSY